MFSLNQNIHSSDKKKTDFRPSKRGISKNQSVFIALSLGLGLEIRVQLPRRSQVTLGFPDLKLRRVDFKVDFLTKVGYLTLTSKDDF